MIKVNWKELIKDYVVFGIVYDNRQGHGRAITMDDFAWHWSWTWQPYIGTNRPQHVPWHRCFRVRYPRWSTETGFPKGYNYKGYIYRRG